MSTLVYNAALFASAAHAAVGQVRKYTGEAYIVHPQEVAKLVCTVTNDESMIAAAWLHDVVEDTEIGLGMIRVTFGGRVAILVDELTDRSVPEDGNRAIRKAIDRCRLAHVSNDAKTIKLGDLISNTRDITSADSKFASTYMVEKVQLLEALRGGDVTLWQKAKDLVDDYYG